ncbi:Rossmann-fold NAD(P)-binding domain-containing protein [Legionella tunisiensis]|nr:sugar nucleotide-binding protein [Legionella tunisiensis]
MKIIVIGASGIIGQAVVEELHSRHEIIKAGYKSGDIRVDITDKHSIEAMFKKLSRLMRLYLLRARCILAILCK